MNRSISDADAFDGCTPNRLYSGMDPQVIRNTKDWAKLVTTHHARESFDHTMFGTVTYALQTGLPQTTPTVTWVGVVHGLAGRHALDFTSGRGDKVPKKQTKDWSFADYEAVRECVLRMLRYHKCSEIAFGKNKVPVTIVDERVTLPAMVIQK